VIADPLRASEVLRDVPASCVGRLIDVARAHGVEPLIAWGARGQPARWQPLIDQRLRFVAALARARAELDVIADVANSIGSRWAVLKGLAVADSVYPRPDLRHGVDIDVLIEPKHLTAMLEALEAEGWTLLDVNFTLLVRSMPGQLKLRSPRGSLLDLHWHVLDDSRLRSEYHLDTDALLGRVIRLPSGIPSLAPVDQLLHLAVHGALSGGNRMLWLADVGYAARAQVDWASVWSAACRARVVLALLLMLDRARDWFDTPSMPESLANQAALRGWRRTCEVVGRLSPLGETPSMPSLYASFSRSVRSTRLRTSVEFGQHAAAFVRTGWKRPPRPSLLTDPRSIHSPLHPAGGPAARREYLARVVASG
jgi:hypothetical protein